MIPARKRKDRAIIIVIANISKGVIIKNDPPELIPKIENKTAYPTTETVRIIAEEIIKIPDIFDFCINIIYLITYLYYFVSEKAKRVRSESLFSKLLIVNFLLSRFLLIATFHLKWHGYCLTANYVPNADL